MNQLQLLQRLKRETSIPGVTPSTLAGFTAGAGNLPRLVDWLGDAYRTVQNMPRNWRWMRVRGALGDVTTSTIAYTIDALLGVSAGTTRFRRFATETRFYRVTSYLAATPQSEWSLKFLEYEDFRGKFLIGTPAGAAPQYWSVSPANEMLINPPDQAYKLRFDYWRSNHELVAETDEPEFPEDYHILLVWQALNLYGSRLAAPEVLARSADEGTRLLNQLMHDQGEQITIGAPPLN